MLPLAALLLPLLAGPQDAAPVSTDGVQWISFDHYRDSLIFLRGQVNGVETDILLDSGAGMTCVSAACANELGLEQGIVVNARGTGGSQAARWITGVDVQVGNLHLENLSVLALEWDGVERRLGRAMPMVLGIEAFEHSVIDIDYPNRRVAFRDAASFEYQGPGRAIDLRQGANHLWSVELSVEGRAPARIMVDTGSNSVLSLDGAYVRQEALISERARLAPVYSEGVGGSRQESITTLSKIEFAGTVLAEVPVRLLTDDGEELEAEDVAGSLGGSLLRRFRVIFDPRRERMILEADPKAEAAPFAKDRVGAQCVWNGDSLFVERVAPASPAGQAGWKEGMVIRQIDGRPIGEDYWKELYRWRTRPAGTRTVLLDDQGEERVLVLEDYF